VLSMVQMDSVVPGCDACNLGARMSKVVGRVSGQPYDHSAFEPIEDSDSGEHSESDQSEDEEERPKKQMYLGRFCAKRTKSFHEFTHWEVSRKDVERHASHWRCLVEIVRPVVDRGTRATIDGKDGIRQGCIR